jgi:hypothetical protein
VKSIGGHVPHQCQYVHFVWLKRVHLAGRTDAMGGSNRVDADIGSDVHKDVAGVQLVVEPAHRAFFLDP